MLHAWMFRGHLASEVTLSVVVVCVFSCQGGDSAGGEQEGLRGGKTFPCSASCSAFCSCLTSSPCYFFHQWISTINNISKRIYLSENAEVGLVFTQRKSSLEQKLQQVNVSCLQELAARVNQSALEAVTPSPSFQQRHESMRPSR